MSEVSARTTDEIEARLRTILCSLAAATFLFTPVELILLEHTGDWIQWVPFGACLLGLLAVGFMLVRPSAQCILAARWLALAIILSGVIGTVQHVLHNLELELEIRPGTTWMSVLPDAFQGAAPSLATGILILGACLILGATYQHPVTK